MEKIKKKKKKHCLLKVAIEETEAISKCFSSLFHIALDWQHQNPALMLSWDYPCHRTGALHLPKRNNTHSCHKCAQDFCCSLQHKCEMWPRLPPSSRGSALGSSYLTAKDKEGKNCKFIRGTWLEMKLEQKGLFFPAVRYLSIFIVRVLLQRNLSVRKVY